jgi:acid phosphatase (class A)
MNRLLVLFAALTASSCASTVHVVAPTSGTEVGEFRPGFLNGYLATADLPDSAALLPAPPAADSAAQAADNATFQELTKFQGTPRGLIAIQDANLSFPRAAATFACALGVSISEQGTPNVNMMLRRTLGDAIRATAKAKIMYQRPRPFMAYKVPSCTPGSEAELVKDGSYPSGHSATGWTWALLLTEIAPERADVILQRGRAFGQSRGICGVHWQSDIEAGRVIGAAMVARLHANPVFIEQMRAARAEVAKARGGNAAPPQNCDAETATLATSSMVPP